MSILLLTTTGRRSGSLRTVPLTFVRDGASLVVVGSYGGMDRSPGWWLNLQQNPEASVQIGSLHQQVIARKASPLERTRLFAEICSRFPVYGRYQGRTAREIPVVILDPAAHR
jgi:deazaflavin-dependent oxidoreductase (nitroreductase family)